MVVDVKVTGVFTIGLLGEIVKLVESGIGPTLRFTSYQFTSSSWNWYPSVPISIPASWQGVFVGNPQALRS